MRKNSSWYILIFSVLTVLTIYFVYTDYMAPILANSQTEQLIIHDFDSTYTLDKANNKGKTIQLEVTFINSTDEILTIVVLNADRTKYQTIKLKNTGKPFEFIFPWIEERAIIEIEDQHAAGKLVIDYTFVCELSS